MAREKLFFACSVVSLLKAASSCPLTLPKTKLR